MILQRRTATVLAIALLAILLAYVLYPSVRTFEAGLSLENWLRVFSSWSSANVRALYNSVSISIYTVVGSAVIGTGFAYALFRYQVPARAFFATVAAIPLALPPLVGVLAFLFLYGESGILPRVIQSVFSLESVPFAFSGLWAVWLVHVYSMYVYFFLFVGAALRRIDRSALEASADLGASSTATFWRVILPELRPAIVSASLLVFMISMASFTAPLLFAGTEQFLTLQIYNYKVNGSMALSATVSTLLTLICVGFLFALEWSNRTGIRGASKGIQPPPNPVDAGPTRIGVIAASILFAAFVLLPVLTVAMVSFAREGSWTTQILPSQYTADNYLKLFGDASFALPIRNSLILATISTAANLVFGVAAALTLVKTRAPFKWLIRLLVILPFAIPGTVVAINLIITFSRESALSFGEILLGTFWLMPLAYFIRNIPIIVRSTIASLETFDDRLIEASADLGARASRTFRRVVLPAILPGILAGTLLTFVASVGEFVSSILLYVYQNRPISVEIWSQLRIYDFGAAAAYSVLLMLIILAASVGVRILGGRERERPRLPRSNGVPI